MSFSDETPQNQLINSKDDPLLSKNPSCEKIKTKPPHAGHRSRMMKKAKEGEISDVELLELLLFYAQPRRNTSDLAHQLLSKYGTFKALLNANPEDLKEFKGLGENILFYLQRLSELCNRYQTKPRKHRSYDIIMTQKEFWGKLEEIYSAEKNEVADVYLLDCMSNVFAVHRLGEGDYNNVEFHASALTEVLLEKVPMGIMIVHNHPIGKAKPSIQDEVMTCRCQVICSLNEIMFCDHIIYADGEVFSYYNKGRMQTISKLFAIDTLVPEKGVKNANGAVLTTQSSKK